MRTTRRKQVGTRRSRSFMEVKSGQELEEGLQIEKGKGETNTADDDRWRWTDVKQNTCVWGSLETSG